MPLLRFRVSAVIVVAFVGVAGCRTERIEPNGCGSNVARESWTEIRERAPNAADTSRASLSLTLTSPLDSLDQMPSGAMISLVIAGPRGATQPDTVRLLAADVPGGPLWSGDDLRPGTYTASLTTDGYSAGPKEFALASGEKVVLQTAMGRACDPPAK